VKIFHNESNKIFMLYSGLQIKGNQIHRKAWKQSGWCQNLMSGTAESRKKPFSITKKS
jgi:hypothetical protein